MVWKHIKLVLFVPVLEVGAKQGSGSPNSAYSGTIAAENMVWLPGLVVWEVVSYFLSVFLIYFVFRFSLFPLRHLLWFWSLKGNLSSLVISKIFLFVFGFHQFYYEVSTCLCIYPSWIRRTHWIYVLIFHQVGKFSQSLSLNVAAASVSSSLLESQWTDVRAFHCSPTCLAIFSDFFSILLFFHFIFRYLLQIYLSVY